MDTENRKVAIVVPTIREECIQKFLEAWQFGDVPVYVVEDNPERTFSLPPDIHARHYSWQDIEGEMGADSWIIPRRSDCIRSYGFLKAYEDGADVIITLDDDCLPLAPSLGRAKAFIADHLAELDYRPARWVTTVDNKGLFTPRGIPYQNAGEMEIVLNMGGWRGVPDLDGPQSLAWLRRPYPHYEMHPWHPVPQGQYFPMCGMNLAFDTKIVPLMYFLLMGQDEAGVHYPYDRFGDIWCGIIAKKILDAWGYGVSAGTPLVHHIKASNPLANLHKETPGLLVNEWLWRKIDAWELQRDDGSLVECYRSMARHIGQWAANKPEERRYWLKLRNAMQQWTWWTENIRKARYNNDHGCVATQEQGT